jgi:hypothetical protein
MIDEDATEVFPSRPWLVVVEAKRSSVLSKPNTKAQLLAQIRHIQIREYASYLNHMLMTETMTTEAES